MDRMNANKGLRVIILNPAFLLIAFVASVSVIGGCTSFLMWDAAMEGKTSAVRNYLNRGADVNAKFSIFGGQTALMKALCRGHIETAELLINRGADVNAKDNDGQTALMLAARGQSLDFCETVKLLIDKGADVNAKNKNGVTVLMHAARGHVETVKLLIDRSADVNAKDNGGGTALMHVGYGDIETVKLLLDMGVDPPSETAILFLPKHVYLKSSNHRYLKSRDYLILLWPGIHNIKVTYKRFSGLYGMSYKVIGKPISLTIDAKSGHFYAVQFKTGGDRWWAWIEKWR